MFCCGSSRNVEEPQRLTEARDWGTGPGGQRLGGAASEPGAALRAAERRQAPDTVERQKEEVLGRLREHYQRLGEEMPMGLKPLGEDPRHDSII